MRVITSVRDAAFVFVLATTGWRIAWDPHPLHRAWASAVNLVILYGALAIILIPVLFVFSWHHMKQRPKLTDILGDLVWIVRRAIT